MPEEKLSYTQGVLDKIRASYDKLSREELLDLICYISKTYIVEQTIPFDVPIPERDESSPGRSDEELPDADVLGAPGRARTSGADTSGPSRSAAQRFATLVDGLKKRTPLPQLDHFSVVDGVAVLVVDNQKITFGERVTVEFMPARGRPANAPASSAPPSAPFGAPAPLPAPSSQRKDLPGGDGRVHPGGPRPAPAPPPPPPRRDEPRREDKGGDLADVDHIVERFKRLDLD